MSILLFSSDLMIQSRVASAASQAGIAAPQVLAPHDVPTAKTIEGDRYCLAILDLSLPDLNISQTVSMLREHFPAARIAAFAPHVHTAKLEAARTAGCDQVVSRGQFDREVDAIVANNLGSK